MIETHELTKRFGGFEAVSKLSLRVPRGQITGFLGQNGAGKSTTLKMLLGMVHPTSGSGTVAGHSISDPRTNREMRRRTAYVAEDKQLYAYMTVLELVRFTRSFYADWDRSLERAALDRFRLPPNQLVRSLSKGMRTKLALLLALARRPTLLILDEPSEGLDPVSIEDLLRSLVEAAAAGTTVFFSSHQIAEVERISDRVCIIDRGRLQADLALEEMRRDYRWITIGFAGERPAALFNSCDVLDVRWSTRQVQILARGGADNIVAAARAAGALSVEVAPVALREVFLATVTAPA